MKIVIDIPEEEYNALYKFFHGYKYPHTLGLDGRMYYAVANGVILPKGHGRLIEETDRLKMEMRSFERYTGIEEAPYEYASELLNKVPTIIEADMRKEASDV